MISSSGQDLTSWISPLFPYYIIRDTAMNLICYSCWAMKAKLDDVRVVRKSTTAVCRFPDSIQPDLPNATRSAHDCFHHGALSTSGSTTTCATACCTAHICFRFTIKAIYDWSDRYMVQHVSADDDIWRSYS